MYKYLAAQRTWTLKSLAAFNLQLLWYVWLVVINYPNSQPNTPTISTSIHIKMRESHLLPPPFKHNISKACANGMRWLELNDIFMFYHWNWEQVYIWCEPGLDSFPMTADNYNLLPVLFVAVVVIVFGHCSLKNID